ncbi:MAG: phosphatase PAP2 family protein [Eubacterium sp.]|nr:phosphatase PAP2 family protein [Eubacterium sp.]
MLEWITNTDVGILLLIQEQIRAPWLSPAVVFITSLGNAGIVWVVLSLLLLIPEKTRKAGCISILALLGSLLLNNLLLKNLVGRVRPYDAVTAIVPLVAKPADSSFPSGHTGSSFASAWVLHCHLPKRAGVPLLLLAALIGLSRLYVGVHYPSDVLAGVFTGILSALFAEQVFPALYARFWQKQ